MIQAGYMEMTLTMKLYSYLHNLLFQTDKSNWKEVNQNKMLWITMDSIH